MGDAFHGGSLGLVSMNYQNCRGRGDVRPRKGTEPGTALVRPAGALSRIESDPGLTSWAMICRPFRGWSLVIQFFLTLQPSLECPPPLQSGLGHRYSRR